jgi:hypothetical protein
MVRPHTPLEGSGFELLVPSRESKLSVRPLETTPEFETASLPQPEYNCAPDSNPAGSRELDGAGDRDTGGMPGDRASTSPFPRAGGDRLDARQVGPSQPMPASKRSIGADRVAEVTSADLNPDAICCMTCGDTDGGDAR